MEDPKIEIIDVVRALVTQPTLQKQADTLRKYFSPDVRFYHYYIDTLGIEDLIAVYQVRPAVPAVPFASVFSLRWQSPLEPLCKSSTFSAIHVIASIEGSAALGQCSLARSL